MTTKLADSLDNSDRFLVEHEPSLSRGMGYRVSATPGTRSGSGDGR